MVKTTTSVSLDSTAIELFRNKYKDKSFSEYVESLVLRDLGERLSLNEVNSKLKEAQNQVEYYEDKMIEMIKEQENETEVRAKEEIDKIELMKLNKSQKLNEIIERFKGFPEINNLIKDSEATPTILFNNVYMLGQVEKFRAKYGARIGVVQLRDVVIALSEKAVLPEGSSSQVPPTEEIA